MLQYLILPPAILQANALSSRAIGTATAQIATTPRAEIVSEKNCTRTSLASFVLILVLSAYGSSLTPLRTQCRTLSHACPPFRTPAHDACRQTWAVLIRDERGARPCFDNAQDFRARSSKIHKRYRLAKKIADVCVPYDKNMSHSDGAPVHKLVGNVLMSRAESKT